MQHRKRIVATGLVVLALTACGGSAPEQNGVNDAALSTALATAPAQALAPPQATGLQAGIAEVLGCTDVRVHDNGTVIYVTVAADCQPAAPLRLNVRGQDDVGFIERTIQVAAFDTEVALQLRTTQRRLSVHRRGTWRALSNGEAWAWRDGAGLLAKDDGLYLLGGWGGGQILRSDVWFTRDLKNWKQLTPAAPWQGRHGAGWVVHGSKLWVLGGDLLPDVWSSSDGIDWHLESSNAAFGSRYTPIAASLGGRLLLYAGMAWGPTPWCAFEVGCFAHGFNDVWSSQDGAQWSPLQTNALWAGRGLIHGTQLYKGRVYIVSGGLKLAAADATLAETSAEFHDVWSSSDGIAWRRETEDAGFTPRTHIATLGTSHGCYVAGGSITRQLQTTNEVWFAADCVQYSLVPGYQQLAVRHAASLAEFNGSLVLLGGHRDTAGTTVWQYFADN